MKKVKVSVFLTREVAQQLKLSVAIYEFRGASDYVSFLIKENRPKRLRQTKGPGGQPGPESKEDL